MNTWLRRVLLGLTLLSGLLTGVWAEFLPRQFYDAFPGLGLQFVGIDGPFNEHLIRDIGSFYLAFAVLTLAALLARSAALGRWVGLGWAVFGTLHFGYHVTHPEGTAADYASEVVALALVWVLAVLLLLPGSRPTPSTMNKETR